MWLEDTKKKGSNGGDPGVLDGEGAYVGPCAKRAEDENIAIDEESNKLATEEDLSREFRQAENSELPKENGQSVFTDRQKKAVEDFQSKVEKISQVSEKETEIVMELEKETKNKAHQLEIK